LGAAIFGGSIFGAARLAALGALIVAAQGLMGTDLVERDLAETGAAELARVRAAFCAGLSSMIGAGLRARRGLGDTFGLGIALISAEGLTSTKHEHKNKYGTLGGASRPVENPSMASLIRRARRAKKASCFQLWF
jgi:hypothetical protein